MEGTIKSLQDAIKSNQIVQELVRVKIESIAQQKIENRRRAASISTRVPLMSMIDTQAVPSDRLWRSRFFMDQSGSVPDPNDDSILRAKLEIEMLDRHKTGLWNSKEISCLHDIVNEIKTRDELASATLIDFQEVAISLNERMKSQRPAEECQVKYQPNRAPFTKKESLSLLRAFHNKNDLVLPNRTKWQAFQAFHAASNRKTVPWTKEQDEVLFKTVAASGPQQVISQHFASNLSAVLEKTPKTILQRTMTSLLNPNFVNDVWSDEDERRLCLLMKVYRDSPNPMVSVSSHFHYRSSRSVHDKWSRTLDPSYDLDKHYTPEEDEKLKLLTGDVDWKETEKEFPGRLSQSLAKRWKDLVSKEKVVEQVSQSLKRKFKDVDQNDVVLRIKRSKADLRTGDE